MGVSKYTPELADEICRRLSSGETLRGICRDTHMPSWFTIYRWVDSDSEFASRFARARQAGCDAVLDEVMSLADAPLKSDDLAVKPADIVAQRRMQIDTRFKFIARVNPSKYGERTAMELTGPNGGPVQFGDTERVAKVAAMVMAAQAGKGEDEQ